jgi:hypothetical protein
MYLRPSRRLAALVAAAVIPLASACSSDSASGPSLSGSWHGFVTMHDEFGVPLTNDSGVVVTVSNNGHTGPSTLSSATGSYTLDDMRTGTYTLTYSGVGIGTFLRPEIAFIGGGTQFLGIQGLSTASTASVTGLAATSSVSAGTLKITGSIAPPPAGLSRLVRLFFGSASTVSAAAADYSLSTSFKTTTGVLSVAITDTTLANLRAAFGTGTPAYVIGYGDSFFTDSYVDTATGNTVYPNVSTTPSNIVAFIVP